MFLSTCNRVEILFCSSNEITTETITDLFLQLKPGFDKTTAAHLAAQAELFSGEDALRHLFAVASSLDSLVVGEREIITQVRKAFEFCRELGISGDTIRLAVQQAIVTAKEIYTETAIARNPVSVVSLAYRRLRELNISNEARFIVIGAGETNTTMAKYLKKHAYGRFAVFNRTLSRAEKLAAELGGKAYQLSELVNYKEGFDVIITCTGSEEAIITKELYSSLLNGDKNKKVVIDLAVPNDLSPEVTEAFDVNLIAVSNLREIANQNLEQRQAEMENCKQIIARRIEESKHLFRARQVELAFSEIPQRVREIRETALNEVFASQVNQLDEKGKEVLAQVISYMEKKYNAVAMKTAREALLEK